MATLRSSILKSVTGIGLIAAACWNIRAYTIEVLTLPPRAANEVVNDESAWEPIHKELDRIGYGIGDLSYVTARALRGEPVSEAESIHRMMLYYAVIPLNLVHDRIDTPFVLADFRAERPAQLPPGLTQFYDPGNGLVLLKSAARQ